MSKQNEQATTTVNSGTTQTVQPFDGVFTQQEPIPEEAIESAIRVMRSGRLHRYNNLPEEESEASLLEQEFAQLTGAKYVLAVASGGYAMGCAMRAVGVKAGDKVLSNGFTLAPVPGAIASLGGQPHDCPENIRASLHSQLAIESRNLSTGG